MSTIDRRDPRERSLPDRIPGHVLPAVCNRRGLLPRCAVLVALLSGCGELAGDGAEGPPEGIGVAVRALSTIDCGESTDVGYTSGNAFTIRLVTVDGKKVEKTTANAYYVMAQAAAATGVHLKVVSGFRTMAEQTYLYNCYKSCSCNSCNLAAKPGYSNHQSGHALDLNTSASGVLGWLNAHGGSFGFKRTVPSEDWHWEWWGGGPGGGPCGSCKPSCKGSKIVSADCGEGDCAAYGATCADDAKGVRCVSVFCPAVGQKKVCVGQSLIGECKDGAISTGDCGVYGAYCSSAGAAEARCVSVFCVASPAEVPTPKTVCLPNGKLASCNGDGALAGVEDCPAGQSCVASSGAARCEAVPAPPPGDTGTDSDGTAPLVVPPDSPPVEVPSQGGLTPPPVGPPAAAELGGGCVVASAAVPEAPLALGLLALLALVRRRR
jgi:D-alanyl-D-alanine carboxypeptidase